MKIADQQQDFSGGMVDYLPPDRIPQNAYRFGENVECRNGILRTRRGQAVLDPGVGPGASGTRTPVASCRYISATGVEYLAIALVEPDGTLSTRLANPMLAYNAEIVFPGGAPVGAPLGAPDDGDGVVLFQYGRALYLFRPASSAVYRFAGLFSSLQWDAVPAEPPEGGGEWMPSAVAACVAFGRVWLATRSETDYGVYDCVTASDITMLASGGLTWDIVKHNWQIGAEDHSDIVAMVPHSAGRIIVFKRHSVYALIGCEGYIDGVYCETLAGKHGAVSGGAALRVGDDVWYLSDDGVRSVTADQESGARAVEMPVSRPVGGLVSDSLVLSSVSRFMCSGAVFDSYALFTVPYGQAVPNAILAYDLVHGCWPGVWTGIHVRRVHVFSHDARKVLLGVGDDGVIQRLLTEDRWGQADAPTAQIVTRAFNCGSTERRKSFRGGLLGLSSGGAEYTLKALDYDTSAEKTLAAREAVASSGWMIHLPDEGLNIPDEGIWLKDVDLARRKFFVGMQARSVCLSLTVDAGALDLRAVAVEGSAGRAMTEY